MKYGCDSLELSTNDPPKLATVTASLWVVNMIMVLGFENLWSFELATKLISYHELKIWLW